MWEVLVPSPRGRLSTRKFIVLLATLLVAWFVVLFASAPLAHAADAEIYLDEDSDKQRIDYNGHTYSGPQERKDGDGLSKDVPIGAIYFLAQTDSSSKLHIIYFKVGEDYSVAKNAEHIVYDNESKTSAGPFTNPSDPISLFISPRAPPESENLSACDISGGLGWIICPLTNTLASAMDYIYGIVAKFLEVQPLATTSDQAMYRAWSYIRTFANVAFILAFLVIIYSQITNIGIGNYGIKKLLPRIIIAAVLVNVSYWICAVAVDVSNILGYAVQDVFIMIRNSLVGSEGDNWNAVSWESMATLVLSGGSIAAGVGIGTYLGITSLAAVTAGAGIVGGVYLLLPILLSVLFVVLVTFLVLAARQAFIVILIVLAPLAFVAYLLPNTEKWFERWRSALFTLLLVFPAFSVVFGGSQLAASVIIQSVLQKSEGGAPLDLTMIMLAMAVQVIPLAITPLLLKLGGGLLNRFAGVINNPTKGVFDRGKTWANERRDQAAAQGNRRIASRVENGQLNGRRRFNAQSMAYRRNMGKIGRDSEKSANEALTKGYYSQTAEGRRVHNLGERAKLEQGLGDNQNQASWNNLVRTSPNLRNRSERSHTAHATAELYKKSVEADEQEHWQHNLQSTTGLRNIQTQSHLAEGRANLTAEAIKNADERSLQTQINATPGLRNVKIQADVDAGHAKLQADSVAADGKLTFQNEVDNDRNLKLMKVATYVADQQAGSIDNRLTKNAEARWNQLSRTDVHLQGLRLRENKDTDAAKRVEEQYTSFIENIRAKGGDAPEVAQANTSLARSIKSLHQDISLESSVQESAKIVQQSNFSVALKEDANLRLHAAGVGGKSGVARVLAKAKSVVSSAYLDDIKNIKNGLDYPVAKDNDKLEELFNSTSNMSEKVAYAQAMAVNGAPGIGKLKETISAYEQSLDLTKPEKMEELDDFKELLGTESSILSAGKDLEFWITKSPVKDAGGEVIRGANGETFDRTFTDLTNDTSTWTNLSANAFAAQNAATHHSALELLSTAAPDAYKRTIDMLRNNVNARAGLKQGVRERFSIYGDDEYEKNPSLPPAGTITS